MKRKRILFSFVVFGVLFLCIMLLKQNFINKKTELTTDFAKSTQDLLSEEPKLSVIDSSHVDSIYIDMEKSIDKLAEKAELIVSGSVLSQYEHNGVSTISEFLVKSIVKGASDERIKILQLNDDSVLEVDKEYILILGKQSYHENTYYITGGTQGIFLISGDKLVPNDDDIKSSFREVINSDKNSIKNEKDLLVEYLKTIE